MNIFTFVYELHLLQSKSAYALESEFYIKHKNNVHVCLIVYFPVWLFKEIP